jgi:hypothetical protein
MAALVLTASIVILVPVKKDSKELSARRTLTIVIRIHVRMMALVLTASIAILVPVKKDSKELTARSMLTTALQILA